MNQKFQNIALIVAAGRGTRAARQTDHLPKQYMTLGQQSVLSYSIQTFAQHEKISAILVVIHPDDVETYKSAIPQNCAKLLPPVFGGDTRQHSVLNGLQALADYRPETVLIHDAARPFIDQGLIDTLLTTLKTERAALPALPVTDTIKQAENHVVAQTLPRDSLWRAQTPQSFHFVEILEAHKAASQNGTFTFTDDASIAEWHGMRVRLIEGSENNRKLTMQEDFLWAESIIKQQKGQFMQGSYRVGSGFDVHAFTEGDHVVLCGIKIPHEKALKGHSDADVGLHAITDALLGAIGDGDIGTHFPPSDPKWKGAASDLFLKDAMRRVKERGGIVQNIDVTLICEAPKIGPHRESIRARLSEIMGLPIDRISVKATTTESLGFTGRREGIASLASVSVWLP